MASSQENRERINSLPVKVTRRGRNPDIVDVEDGREEVFATFKEALGFIQEGSNEWQLITEELVELRSLSAELIPDNNYPEGSVRITIAGNPNKIFTAPKSCTVDYLPDTGSINSPGISVSSSVNKVDAFNIIVSSREDPYLYRGLAWVMMREDEKPHISFFLKPKASGEQYVSEELMGIVGRVHRAVFSTFQDILNGIFPE